MSTLLRLPISPENLAAYRFGQAELQLAAERLLIGGREVPLPPMAYRFLLCLCQARGGLLARAHVFDVLWPGGGSGSDEALAQIVLKVRQALGDEGRALVTVRGRGFRLDLPVEPVPLARLEAVRTPPPVARADVVVDEPVIVPTAAPMAPEPVSPSPSSPREVAVVPRRRVWIAALLIAAVVLAGALVFLRQPQAALDGYAFHADAFGPISAAGTDNIRLALMRDNEGDRASAEQGMRAVLQSEPDSALAPFYLSLWMSGDEAETAQWKQLLQQRLPRDAGAYVQLLSRWVSLPGDAGSGAEIEVLNAALKLQPDAWQLHLARSHVLLRQLRFDAALADLRQIPLDRLAERHAMFVMSDRAALGDADAMEAALPALTARAPAIADYVRGRIALAQGRWDVAQVAFEAAGQRAERETLLGSMNNAWLLAAVAAGAQKNWDSVERDASQARRIGVDHKRDDLAVNGEVMAGYAQHRRGEADLSTAHWDRAAALFQRMGYADDALRLWLQRARMQPAWALAHPAPSTEPASGLAALTVARQAWLACDNAGALKALAGNDGEDIRNSYFADEADLLRVDLGADRLADRRAPQLPYPALGRWITWWESDRAPGPRPCAGAPTR